MGTKNELAVGEMTAIKDFTQEAGGVIVLGNIEQTEKILTALSQKHIKMVVTPDNLKEARKALAELRAPRYDLDKIIKHNSKAYNELKKVNKESLEALRFIVNEPEQKLLEQIKPIEEAIQAEKEKKKREEEAERNRINDSILGWSNKLAQVYENCVSIRSIKSMQKALEELQKETKDGAFAEFEYKAEELYYRYTEKIPGLNERIDKAKAQDEEAKRLEEEKEKLASDKLENYTVLLETIEALGGETHELHRDDLEPPTEEDFKLVRNEIQRLKNPPETVEPVNEEPKESVLSKPNAGFDNEPVEQLCEDHDTELEEVAARKNEEMDTGGSIAEPQSFPVDYSREELIAICEKAFVPQKDWEDRDSSSAQIKLGGCYALLKAGCEFEIKTEENTSDGSRCVTDSETIWIQFYVHDFLWFELCEDDNKGSATGDYHFYLPTVKRLLEAEGSDWY